MKNVETVSISIPFRLIRIMDDQRMDVPRSRFVQRILEKALGEIEKLPTERTSKSARVKKPGAQKP